MIEFFKGASVIQQALFVMGAGISGVFIVLITFYILIKLLSLIFPGNADEIQEDRK